MQNLVNVQETTEEVITQINKLSFIREDKCMLYYYVCNYVTFKYVL